MAVPEQTPYIEHTGNGATTSFSLGFQCESKDHLIVLVDEIEPPIATWSLTGGNVVFTTAPAAGKKIKLQRNTPFNRTAEYQSFNNSFRPQTVNIDFDRIWWKLQELGIADWILGARIDALKNYVDRKDDELKAYLMEEIRKQGVALDQLDEYYNYLMERLAQIAVDKGWDAAFIVDATGRNQQQVNDGVDSLDALRLIDPKKKGRRVYLNSVIADKNLGSGTFVSTTKSSLIDNGGTIVDSANPNLMWVRVEYDVMTAEMFGCIGDGVADDTAAMTKFAAAKYNHKEAANKYALTATPVFMIEHDSTVIDFSKSTIIGTAFARNAIQVLTSRASKTIKFLAGSYDGGGVVNNYVELSSLEGGFSDLVVVECRGVLKNFSNQKNTSTTAPIKCGIKCDVGRVINPIVYNVVNKNGVSGSSSSVGVALTQYRKIGLIENPIIEGVYTESGVDADGLILFEEKDVSTTGTGIGIVKNANLKQCAGRGIKSQSNLAVFGANISLSEPEKGVVLTAWRGVDAQLGGMYCQDINYELNGANLFVAGNGSTLFQSSGSDLGPRDQIVDKVTVKGNSNIRYFMQLAQNNPKTISINNVKLLNPQTALSCLYVTAGVTVTELISLTNFTGDWWTSGNLFFDATYNGAIIPNLNINNVAWNGYDVFNVSKFAKIRILDTKLRISGTLAYNNIHKDSDFYYLYETSASGGITYTNPNIPAFAKRACWYRKGDVLSSLKNNQLIFLDNLFYQSLTTTPTAIT